MFSASILSVSLLRCITEPQSSTRLNWGSDAMLFDLCLRLPDRCISFTDRRGAFFH